MYQPFYKRPFTYIGMIVLFLVVGGIYLDYSGSRRTMPVFENILPNREQQSSPDGLPKLGRYGEAPDFVGIQEWLNSSALHIDDLKGKVVLVDFWTYSCINCIRTLPHITRWYNTYKDDGLVVVGVHTPEFAFEKNTENVRGAIARYGILYPVAQDNSYRTWNAYDNHYWPAKYLIDKDGTIVYTHFGEGDYEETESAIRYLLGMSSQGEQVIDASLGPDFSGVQSPEIYFGALRNRNWGNGTPGRVGTVTAVFPKTISKNTLYLDGAWNINEEYAETVGADVRIQFQYDARDVYMVASAAKETAIEVLVDGNRIPLSLAGADVENGVVRVQSERLYHLIKGETYGVHTLELRVRGAGFRAFTFTFG